MVCFTKRKKKEKKGKKKKGISIEYLPYGRDETLGRVSNFFFCFWFLCAWRKQKALSFLDHGREIYALAWAGRQ